MILNNDSPQKIDKAIMDAIDTWHKETDPNDTEDILHLALGLTWQEYAIYARFGIEALLTKIKEDNAKY